MQVPVANSQWIFIVELHQFHNLYNAEVISDEGICCCDSSEPCASQASELPGCGEKCDTWFTADVSHCMPPYPCSIYTSTIRNAPSIINFNNKLIFVLNSLSDMVSVKIASVYKLQV